MREDSVNTKPKVEAGRKVKLDAAPSIRLPLPGRWLSKEAGPRHGPDGRQPWLA